MSAGFDPDVWNGTKPMVAPMCEPIQVGSVVWEQAPEEADHDRRGGIVAATAVDDNGERVLTVLTATNRTGRFTVRSYPLPASEVDGDTIEPPTAHRLHQAARQICRSLGDPRAGLITGWHRWLLECAVGFVVLADEIRRPDA